MDPIDLLAQEEALDAAVLRQISDAVVITDAEGIVRFWNPAATRIFGHHEHEALGQSLDLMIPEKHRERHWSAWKETMESGQSRYSDGDLLAVPGLHKDGHRISLEFSITLLKDSRNRIQAVAAVMRDVTARFEETKQLKTRLRALERRVEGDTESPASSG